jgi:hypothetical protein
LLWRFAAIETQSAYADSPNPREGFIFVGAAASRRQVLSVNQFKTPNFEALGAGVKFSLSAFLLPFDRHSGALRQVLGPVVNPFQEIAGLIARSIARSI